MQSEIGGGNDGDGDEQVRERWDDSYRLITDRLAKFFRKFIPETWGMAEKAIVDFQRGITRWHHQRNEFCDGVEERLHHKDMKVRW